MSELWGIQSGQSQRQADDQSKGLFELRMAEGSIDLQTKQLTYQNAALMQTRQEQAIKMMQMAGNKNAGASNPTEDVSNTLLTMANIDIQSGLPEQGLAAIKAATSLQANHSKIVEQTTMDSIRRFSFFSNLLSDVHDQSSWEQAKMIYQSNFPGQLDPKIAGKPWSPDLQKMLQSGTVTALQKANTDLSRARADEVKTNSELAKVRIPYVKAGTVLEEARTEALKKNGGTNALPKAANVSDVKDMITHQYPDIEKDDATFMARRVAASAKKIQDANPDMSPLEANTKAFQKAKEQGMFFGLKPGRTRAGSSTENPMSVPMKNGKPDSGQLVDNMIYDGKDLGDPGNFYAFDKARGGFVKVAAGDQSEETDDTEDEDEDK